MYKTTPSLVAVLSRGIASISQAPLPLQALPLTAAIDFYSSSGPPFPVAPSVLLQLWRSSELLCAANSPLLQTRRKPKASRSEQINRQIYQHNWNREKRAVKRRERETQLHWLSTCRRGRRSSWRPPSRVDACGFHPRSCGSHFCCKGRRQSGVST